jgi:hypothetical protein
VTPEVASAGKRQCADIRPWDERDLHSGALIGRSDLVCLLNAHAPPIFGIARASLPDRDTHAGRVDKPTARHTFGYRVRYPRRRAPSTLSEVAELEQIQRELQRGARLSHTAIGLRDP